MIPPKWAQELTLKAMLWWEEQNNKVPNFKLDWRHGNYSGTAWNSPIYRREQRILISAGRDRIKAKLILLHEIAHQFCGERGHSQRFWDIAWQLYRWAKLPIRDTLRNESNYRKGALVAYKRNKRS